MFLPMSMPNIIGVHVCDRVFMCVFVFVCINARMPDQLAFDQSGTGMKKLTMLGQVWYRTKPRQSGIFLVRYRTEIVNHILASCRVPVDRPSRADRT